MLEEIYEDNLIGDPNDLEELIEQRGDLQFGEEEELETEDNINNEAAADDIENADGTRVEPKKKRTVQNPQPKLDPERLKGPRGIAVIENTFKDFKFHGKGYERVDLNRVMKRLEHWAHRLYPRFQYDDCIDKIEKLGQKKPVQVYVKKIRMGLETVEEPMVLLDEAEEPEVQNEAPIDTFDELLSQQLSQVRAENRTPVPSQIPQQSRVPQSTELTAEQRERMLRNRLVAEERRLARMKAKHELERAAEAELSTTAAIDTPSVSNNESSTSFELALPKINNNVTQVINVCEVTTAFKPINDQETNVVNPICNENVSTHSSSETEETGIFPKAIEVEGSSTISISADCENLNILSEPVDNKEIDNASKPSEQGEIVTFPISVQEEKNLPPITIEGKEINVTSMLVDSEEICTTSKPVDTENTNTSPMLVDAEETNTSSMPVDSADMNTIPVDT